jgi:predicted  nucleic acid-binding Zn-ribbon protein
MIDRFPASSRARQRGLCALAGLMGLVLGASQASALPQVQNAPRPGILRVQAANPGEPALNPRGQPGAEQPAPANQQAPLGELSQLLAATRAKLEELSGATQSMAEQRAEAERLRQENGRLAGELEQVNGRLAELEESSKRAEAEIAYLTNANDAAAQNVAHLGDELAEARRQNADLEARLAHADSARATAEATLEKTRTEMRQATERSSAEAERLNSDLAAAKGQLGEATTAAVEAEGARQRAVSEAQQVRGEAERANEELVAARNEIARFKAANGQLEQQIAALGAESKSAMDSARQTLTLMEEKIGELSAALAGAGLMENSAAPAPRLNSGAPADERSAATAAPSRGLQAPPQKPGEAGGTAESAALTDQGPAAVTGPADEAADLKRFDANVRYLNSRAVEMAGADLFSGIKSPGDGVVHVSTTAAWQKIPTAGQHSYLDSLFDLWTVAQERSGPAVVRIVDPSGRVLLEKSGTGEDTKRD